MAIGLSTLHRACAGTIVFLAFGASTALAQTAILGSTTASAAYVFPNVTFSGATCPATVARTTVSGIPSGSQPHGVGYYGSDNALISNFGVGQVFNVQISTSTVLNTISTGPAGYNGQGTIAVAPNLQYALMGIGSSLTVMKAPFNAPTFTSVSLPGSISTYQTQGIVFDSASRAYVAHSGGVTVLDPPYTSVAFTMPGGAEAIAINPAGNVILTTRLGNVVQIRNGPFSAATTTTSLSVPGSSGLDGISITPDGARALVVDGFAEGLYAITGPFTAASTVQKIPLPSGTGSLEDVSISADGNFALATGNGGTSIPLIRAPFTAAGAVACAVPITGERGAGAVRFLPTALQPPVNPPPVILPQVPVPTMSQWTLIGLGMLLALSAIAALRRRR